MTIMSSLLQASPVVLPVLALALLAGGFRGWGRGVRESLLLAALAGMLFVVVINEALTLCQGLTRTGLIAAWGGLVAVLLAAAWRGRRRAGTAATAAAGPATPPDRRCWWSVVLLLPLGLMLATVAVIAVTAPPNNWDSMAYHMARVMHWIQNQGIGHYPTHITRQVFMPPAAEWIILHLQLLSGGDRFANLVQWGALAGSVIGVSWIARLLGARYWGQTFAAVAAGTLPMALLQASSTQNDLAGAFWLVCGAAFGLNTLRGAGPGTPEPASGAGCRWWPVAATGTSFGLALLTKGTAYPYALPFLLWFGAALAWQSAGLRWPPPRHAWRASLQALRWRPAAAVLLLLAGTTLLPTAGHCLRNYAVSGHLLGPGLETTGWRVEPAYYANHQPGLRVMASNLMRNGALQFGQPDFEHLLGLTPADAWLATTARRWGWQQPEETRNQRVQELVTRWHAWLHWDVNDPDSSWDHRPFSVPVRWNHEDCAPNPLHAVLALLTVVLLPWPRWPEKGRTWSYLLAVAGGVCLFALLLRWQEWHTRLMLPSLILAMPLVGLAMEKALTPWVGLPLAAGLLLAAVPYVVNNEVRPIFGNPAMTANDDEDGEAKTTPPGAFLSERSVFRQPREEQYFASRPDKLDNFTQAAETIVDSGCANLGLEAGWNDWEYPLWVLIQARGGRPRIEHTGVTNETARLSERPPFRGFVPDRQLYLRGAASFRPQAAPRPRAD
jgi:hypothetical protein